MHLRTVPSEGGGSWGICTPTPISSRWRTVPGDIHPPETPGMLGRAGRAGFSGFGEPPKTLRQIGLGSGSEKGNPHLNNRPEKHSWASAVSTTLSSLLSLQKGTHDQCG